MRSLEQLSFQNRNQTAQFLLAGLLFTQRPSWKVSPLRNSFSKSS